MLRKMLLFVLAVIIPITAAAGCGRPAEKGEKTVEPLKLGVLPDVDSLPFIVAGERGLFEKEGVNVELAFFKNPVERDGALQSGAIDGAVSDILAAAFAVDNGFKVKITSITNGRYVLLASPASGIDSLAGLKNAEIGISKNTIIEYMVDSMLVKAGLKPDETRKIAVPKIPVRLEMLRTGQLKAACLPEPLASVAVNDGAKLLADSNSMEVVPGVMIFSHKAIQQKNELIRGMYRAYEQAARLINKDPESITDLMVEKAGFPEAVKQSFDFVEYTPVSPPSRKDVSSVVNWLASKNLIKKAPAYDDLVTGEFIAR